MKFWNAPEEKLADQLRPLFDNWNELVVLCIGTMHVRGDSLGPLVGSRLTQLQLPGIYVYGTQSSPVHAMNLEETLYGIRCRHPGLPVLAVDAASGPCHLHGCIAAGPGPLYPGAGLNKKLPPAGDMHITGILGFTGPFSLLSLRLASQKKIQKMVHTVTSGIVGALFRV